MTNKNMRYILLLSCIFFVTCFMHRTEAKGENSLLPDSNAGTGVIPNSETYACSRGRGFGMSFDKRYGQGFLNTTVVDANFSTVYNYSVDINSEIIFVYSYNETVNVTTAVRVSMRSPHSKKNFPLMVLVRQQERILSWAIPLCIDHSYAYSLASRTLCPMTKQQRSETTSQQTLVVEFFTMFTNKTSFLFSADILEDFQLTHQQARNTNVTPSQPQYFMYTFPEGISSVHLKVTSFSKICMTVSVQDIQCPVYDLERNVGYRGKHQTMTTQSAMYLQRDDYSSGSLYVVLITKTQDYECVGIKNILLFNDTRNKQVTISIETVLPRMQYRIAIVSALSVFIAFYVVVAICQCCGLKKKNSKLTDPERVTERQPLLQHTSEPNYEAGERRDSDSMVQTELISTMPSATDANSDSPTQPDQPNADDQTKESSKKLKNNIYLWNLVTFAIFYSLPVIQLVISYQKGMQETGNDDLCFYNFDCAHSLLTLSSFNNVFSNIGYVLLGILFMVLVKRKKRMYKESVKEEILQDFGIFYAMGFALCMEGIMSACYHVCPNYLNFRFDTSFMYIIACLLILKIYQMLHPDMRCVACVTYFFMALVILYQMIGVGVVSAKRYFVWIACCIHMLASVLFNSHVYYDVTWSKDCKCNCFIKPKNLCRFILMLVVNVLNLLLALCAVIKPLPLAVYILLIFIGNLVLYSFYYIGMKFVSTYKVEGLWKKIVKVKIPIGCITVAITTWIASIVFFFYDLTDWQRTPAGSRELNRDCFLLQFYDHHDIWHFLSAISLFFTFLFLLTLDDNDVKPDKIES